MTFPACNHREVGAGRVESPIPADSRDSAFGTYKFDAGRGVSDSDAGSALLETRVGVLTAGGRVAPTLQTPTSVEAR